MRTSSLSSLAFLVFLSTTVANAVVVREHRRVATAQRANDIPGVLPRDNDAGLHPRFLSSLHSQRRTTDDSDTRIPRRHRRRPRAHV